MNKYKMFFLHDPIGNYESQITNFDKNSLQQALDQGLSIIGITQNDNREIVKSVDDVREPQVTSVNGFTVVLPSYVDTKVDELAKVVERLIDIFIPSKLLPPITSENLASIKDSIQCIHNETLKTVEEDKKMLESSSSIFKKEEVKIN